MAILQDDLASFSVSDFERMHVRKLRIVVKQTATELDAIRRESDRMLTTTEYELMEQQVALTGEHGCF